MSPRSAPEAPTGRFDVRAPDGVSLAVWVEGDGPPMVLVHGSIQDHTVSAALVAELSSDHTTFAMDRRGFGASGDGPEYAIERDFEDVAAVVDRVAEIAGSSVALFGHSYGANGAAVAAIRGARVQVLEGHAHLAHREDPALVAGVIRTLLAE
ncbi:alpha/beta fold hydrolase [Nocardioides insulae]|uniref:alpha/beta fold hydrolase n=1 Tax=Nocardioides insulae TaxID=394734 RepID=UPI0003F81857|nr:alpha/beta fold hydrolase [Nocardioides insulae]